MRLTAKVLSFFQITSVNMIFFYHDNAKTVSFHLIALAIG